MKKRIMMIIMSIIMLSSCYYADQVFGDIRNENFNSLGRKKNGGGAYKDDKYKSGVYEAIKDVAKRPLNNKVQYEGITLVLPQNTSMNQEAGNIVDLKTGYGLPIGFTSYDGCSEVFYYKKIRGDLYYRLTYNEMIPGVEEIAQKIIRVNGFTKTCNK